jgi:hypothetical protein
MYRLLSVALVLCALAGLSSAQPQALEVYDRCIDGVVYIETVIREGFFRDETAQGSGFLVDRQRKLVVTNYHVTQEKDKIVAFFPVREFGDIIDNPKYYADNLPRLVKNRTISKARIIAQDKDKDLAILQLEQIPDSAKELPLAKADPREQDTLHVLGNPAGRPLWRWAAGTQPAVEQITNANRIPTIAVRNSKVIMFCCAAFNGNSGGPVLNDQGEVLGIAAFHGGPGGILTGAIHYSEIRGLLDSITRHRVFSIENPTSYTLHYQTRWGEDGPWESHTIKPYTYTVHWLKGPINWLKPESEIPYIRFDCSFEEGFQEKHYKLGYFVRELGRGVNPSRDLDAMEYVLVIDKEGKIDLRRK